MARRQFTCWRRCMGSGAGQFFATEADAREWARVIRTDRALVRVTTATAPGRRGWVIERREVI